MHHLPHLHGFAAYVEYLSHISYPGIFLAIIASGHLIPIPESITLIFLGYLLALGKGSVFGYILVGIFSVAFFDMLMYTISLEGSKLAETLMKKVKTRHFDRYREAGDGKLFSLILISHFIPGWRFANPIIAGVTKIPWKKFLLFSIVSSAVYAPLYIGIGYMFHSRIIFLVQFVESLHKLLIPFLVILATGGLIWYLVLENRKSVYNRNHAKK